MIVHWSASTQTPGNFGLLQKSQNPVKTCSVMFIFSLICWSNLCICASSDMFVFVEPLLIRNNASTCQKGGGGPANSREQFVTSAYRMSWTVLLVWTGSSVSDAVGLSNLKVSAPEMSALVVMTHLLQNLKKEKQYFRLCRELLLSSQSNKPDDVIRVSWPWPWRLHSFNKKKKNNYYQLDGGVFKIWAHSRWGRSKKDALWERLEQIFKSLIQDTICCTK